MADVQSKTRKKKGLKHWAFFALRWGVAAVGVWLVVKNMSLRDQALVILDKTTNRPVTVSLSGSDLKPGLNPAESQENASKFPVIDPSGSGKVIWVPRADVLNGPDVKTVALVVPNHPEIPAKRVWLLGVDLVGDLSKNPMPRRLLVADDAKQGPARWIDPPQAPGYKVHVPYPRVQIGLQRLVMKADLVLLWVSLLVFPLTFIITSYRWHELLKALDIHIGIGRAFVINMVGCFYNSFLPGSTGGDVFKAYYASKQTPHRMRAVMSVLVDRAVGLLALIVVGGVTASLQWHIPACRKVSLGAAAICACTVLGMLVFYVPVLHKLSGMDFVLNKLPAQKQVRAAVDAMHLYGKRPALAIWSLVISLPVHGAVVSSAMFAGMAFGLPLHWAYYWVAVPVIVLAGAIPLSPQGAGIMEGFAVLLTRSQGVTVSQAFALTMSIRMVQVIWNLTGGLFVLRGGFHAPTENEKEELDRLPPEDDDDAPGTSLLPA
jgi:uncharacterized protein (TIRG00374 family)